MRGFIPTVEVAYEANRYGIWRPNRKITPFFSVMVDGVASHLFIQSVVLSGFEQINIVFGPKRKGGGGFFFMCVRFYRHIERFEVMKIQNKDT